MNVHIEDFSCLAKVTNSDADSEVQNDVQNVLEDLGSDDSESSSVVLDIFEYVKEEVVVTEVDLKVCEDIYQVTNADKVEIVGDDSKKVEKVTEVVCDAAFLHVSKSDTSENVVKSVPSKPDYLNCLDHQGHITCLKEHNQNLVDDLTRCTEANRVLKSNENDFKHKIKALTKDLSEIKKLVVNKQDTIYAYLDTIDQTKRLLATTQCDFETLKKNLESYSNSSYIIDHIVKSQITKGSNHGVGYNACPPPIHNNFTKIPNEDKIIDFQVTTPLVVDPCDLTSANVCASSSTPETFIGNSSYKVESYL